MYTLCIIAIIAAYGAKYLYNLAISRKLMAIIALFTFIILLIEQEMGLLLFINASIVCGMIGSIPICLLIMSTMPSYWRRQPNGLNVVLFGRLLAPIGLLMALIGHYMASLAQLGPAWGPIVALVGPSAAIVSIPAILGLLYVLCHISEYIRLYGGFPNAKIGISQS
jgi:hypothetical protein